MTKSEPVIFGKVCLMFRLINLQCRCDGELEEVLVE